MKAKDEPIPSDRIEKLLAMMVVQNMKGATQADKALQLSIAVLHQRREIGNFVAN